MSYQSKKKKCFLQICDLSFKISINVLTESERRSEMKSIWIIRFLNHNLTLAQI